MAQRISQLPNEAIPYAQEALGMSSLKRGLGMMNNPNAGMKNQMDGGAFSKPYANAQEQRNAELAMQNVQQNAISARPQANAQAAGQVRKGLTEQSTEEMKAHNYAEANKAFYLEQMGGQGVMKLNSIMESPERQKFVNDIAVSSAMHQEGKAPELGQLTAEANRYM